ncbi:hypothetical protein FO519_006252 [Halicephalobus sp. NKZ332]|nr:hypothetical protein FO519_006252 [Halicephalobus sp. NKZ332]
MFLLFFVSSLLFVTSESVKVPQCNKVSFSLNTTQNSDSTIVYRLNFDVEVKRSESLHNDITLSNFTRWSYNESFYESFPLEFFADSMDTGIFCNSSLPTCGFKNMRDGLAMVSLTVQYSPWESYGEFFMSFWYIEGTIYNSRAGQMFDPVTDTCFHDKIDWGAIVFTADYCCSNFFEVDIPDPSTVNETCTEFYGNTNFTASNGTVVAQIGALYSKSDEGVEAGVNAFTGPDGASFDFSSNSDGWVKGCFEDSVEFPCTVHQPINDTKKDHTYNFVIEVRHYHGEYYIYDAINGQLINRKGVWMKNVEKPTPYTRSDPCWTRSVDSNNDTSSSTSFCCRKWVPVSNGNCAEYRTKTVANMNSNPIDVLNARYILNDNNTMTVEILNFTTTSNITKQNVQLESFASTGETQFCIANTTSGKTCLFNEFKNDNYTFIIRTSDFPDGWNMVTITLNGQQIASPSITVQNPCHIETNNYNGLNSNTTAKTEICCIASPGGPWPGSS